MLRGLGLLVTRALPPVAARSSKIRSAQSSLQMRMSLQSSLTRLLPMTSEASVRRMSMCASSLYVLYRLTKVVQADQARPACESGGVEIWSLLKA